MHVVRRDPAPVTAAVLTLALAVVGAGGQPTVSTTVAASTAATTASTTAAAVDVMTFHRLPAPSVGSADPTWTPVVGPPPAATNNGTSPEGLKKVMWKRCMSKNYVTCVKLALVHLVDRLERANDSYSLAPGVTVSSEKKRVAAPEAVVAKTDDAVPAPPTPAGRDPSEAFDRLLVDKLGRYFSSLTLNVKLLDDATVQSVRKLGEVAVDASAQSGRGKKQKYAHSILLAGWVTGAMLLALGMKAIAVLAGKALMTALMSLLLSGLASLRQGGHSEPKSTTYEIVTKPVYSHSHATAADDAHAAGSQNSPTFRRSIGGGGGGGGGLSVGGGGVSVVGGVGGIIDALQHVPSASSEEADHVVYRIHTSDKTPIYIPIDRRRRRRR